MPGCKQESSVHFDKDEVSWKVMKKMLSLRMFIKCSYREVGTLMAWHKKALLEIKARDWME